jgi:hypothetical protein
MTNNNNHAIFSSNRLRHARQLRQQRFKARGEAVISEDEETLVVSGVCTVLAALVIMAIGAGLATLFFSIFYQPECLKDLTFYRYHHSPPLTSTTIGVVVAGNVEPAVEKKTTSR